MTPLVVTMSCYVMILSPTCRLAPWRCDPAVPPPGIASRIVAVDFPPVVRPDRRRRSDLAGVFNAPNRVHCEVERIDLSAPSD